MAKLSPKHVLEIYLSGKGRMGRGEFWAYGVALTVALALVIVASHFAPSPIGEILTLVVVLAMLWGYGVLLIKRGHDRGRPAWFSILVLLARVIVEFVGGALDNPPALLLAQVALAIYVFIDYAVMPGKGGANRYGPPIGGVNKNPLVLGGNAPTEPALSSEAPKA